MNYFEIVLSGCYNPNNRKFMIKHFVREFKKAETQNYEAEEFFSGCLGEVEYYVNMLEKKRIARLKGLENYINVLKLNPEKFKKDVNSELTEDQQLKETILELELQIRESNIKDHTFDMSVFDDIKYAGYYMDIANLEYLEYAINEAYKIALTPTQAPTDKQTNIIEVESPHFPCDYEILSKVFNLSRDLFTCTENEFYKCVNSADFSNKEYVKTDGKSRLKYLVYRLSKHMGADWYSDACASLEITKSECSKPYDKNSHRKWGYNIENIIKDEIYSIKHNLSTL